LMPERILVRQCKTGWLQQTKQMALTENRVSQNLMLNDHFGH
jgi:hypothetical protein